MQRIIAGSLRGRALHAVPGKEIRPTSARARESVFNILMHRITEAGEPLVRGQAVADICCGSGAMGLEAISRGAETCFFVDASHDAINLVRKNAQKFGVLDHCDLILSDARKLPAPPQPCRAVFIDPPYKQNLLPEILASLHKRNWCLPDGWVIIEQARSEPEVLTEFFQPFDVRTYGTCRVTILSPTPLG